MWPLIGGLISGGASLLGSIFSSNTSAQNTQEQIAGQQAMQKESEGFNAGQAQLNRDFQTQMSNTAFQRSTADMKAAGLNPMMMFGSGGPASVPSGGTASVGTPTMAQPQRTSPFAGLGDAVSKAVNSAVSMKTMDEMTSKIANLEASKQELEARARTEGVRAGTLAEEAGKIRAETETTRARLPAATVEGTTAKDILALPQGVRRPFVEGAFLGHKGSQIISPLTDAVGSASGVGRTFNQIWKDRVDRGY